LDLQRFEKKKKSGKKVILATVAGTSKAIRVAAEVRTAITLDYRQTFI
jgi:hypothetical protein